MQRGKYKRGKYMQHDSSEGASSAMEMVER